MKTVVVMPGLLPEDLEVCVGLATAGTEPSLSDE